MLFFFSFKLSSHNHEQRVDVVLYEFTRFGQSDRDERRVRGSVKYLVGWVTL